MSDLCTEVQRLGKGIGNSNRYTIFSSLIGGAKTVSELVKITKLSQPAVSQHLQVLKQCDLVTSSKQGQEVYYAINQQYTVNLLKKFASSINKR